MLFSCILTIWLTLRLASAPPRAADSSSRIFWGREARRSGEWVQCHRFQLSGINLSLNPRRREPGCEYEKARRSESLPLPNPIHSYRYVKLTILHTPHRFHCLTTLLDSSLLVAKNRDFAPRYPIIIAIVRQAISYPFRGAAATPLALGTCCRGCSRRARSRRLVDGAAGIRPLLVTRRWSEY